MDGKLGRRIAQPSQLQTRHDLIAMWSACAAVRERTDLMTQSADLEIFSDQVMRQFRDDEHRPDVSIFMVDDNMPRLNIEVERRPKKKGWPEFEFAQKLSRYATSAIETLIVTESEARAQALLAFFQTVRAQGIQEYYFNREAKQWFPFGEDCVKKFDVSATVAIWDQASKQFTSAITFNQ